MRVQKLPLHLQPMLAMLVPEPFDDAGWVYETKWDGFRLIAEKKKGKVTLYSRNGEVVSEQYRPVAEALSLLKHDAVIDGELVALDARGRSRFQLLQNALRTKVRLQYCAFDLMSLDGKDMRGLSLLERKAMLKKILPKHALLRYSAHRPRFGTRYFSEAKKAGEEGIIAKRAESTYQSGKRGCDWLKIKTSLRQEVVVVGFTKPRGSRTHFGSLALAVNDAERWRYVGHVGTGFDATLLKAIHERLLPLATKRNPFETNVPFAEETMWVRPQLVVEVQFTEWTQGGEMRHPSFVGIREDKNPREVVAEVAKGTEVSSFTNLSKVLWPKAHLTKANLLAYYRKVAPVLLPHLQGRPLSLNRFPEGVQGVHFFQKNMEGASIPDFVEILPLRAKTTGNVVHYVVCNNTETLLWLANLGTIELHIFNARKGSLAKPDYIVFDLDPGPKSSFKDVITVAQALHTSLTKRKLKSFVKTSGKRGLHIFVPTTGKYSHDKARAYALTIAQEVVERVPRIASIEHWPKDRKDKVFIDVSRNAMGQTVVAPFSPRSTPQATVSTPLAWREVRAGLSPEAFTLTTMPTLLRRRRDLWAGFPTQ